MPLLANIVYYLAVTLSSKGHTKGMSHKSIITEISFEPILPKLNILIGIAYQPFATNFCSKESPHSVTKFITTDAQ